MTMPRPIFLLLPAFVIACTPKPVDIGETLDSSGPTASAGSDDTSTSSTMTSGTTTTSDVSESSSTDMGVVTASSSGNDTGPVGICTSGPGYACTQPQSCDVVDCGALDSDFDENGCPRPTCADGCEEGTVCFDPFAWGLCVGTYACEEDSGACECFFNLDCGAEPYCVPESLSPPPASCLQIADPDECVAAGCDLIADVPSLELVDGMCMCEPISVCVWLDGAAAEPIPTPYFLTGSVFGDWPVLLPERYDVAPWGLLECELDDPGCQCADDCG